MHVPSNCSAEKTQHERVRCERHCANLPFVQTCNRRYLCGASRSVSPMRKKTLIPNATSKDTQPQWEEARTAFCRWKSGTTPRHKKAFHRAPSKLNTRPEMLHAKPHQLPDTENFSITIDSTSVHPCKDPRQHSKWIHTWRS